MKNIRFILSQMSICFMICCMPQALVAASYDDTSNNVNSPSFAELDDYIVYQVDNKNYNEALGLINDQLKKEPRNINMLLYKTDILISLREYAEAMDTIDQIFWFDPGNQQAVKLQRYLGEKRAEKKYNKFSFSQNEALLNDLDKPWSYSSLAYYLITDFGSYGARLNYANRFGMSGVQYQVEAYPKFGQIGYLDLMYAYSDSLERVVPQHRYRIEPYFYLPFNLELSLGQHYTRSFNEDIYTHTGSLASHLGNYKLWFRASHFTPRDTDFFETGLRRNFSDENTFLSFKVGAGKVPDIGDVPPFDEIITIETFLVNLTGQIALSQSLFLKSWVGYTRQKYDTGKRRRILDVAGEIIWRF